MCEWQVGQCYGNYDGYDAEDEKIPAGFALVKALMCPNDENDEKFCEDRLYKPACLKCGLLCLEYQIEGTKSKDVEYGAVDPEYHHIVADQLQVPFARTLYLFFVYIVCRNGQEWKVSQKIDE